MNEIKPVAWGRFSKYAKYWLLTDDMPHEVNSYEALYPAAALEAQVSANEQLQTQNLVLSKRLEYIGSEIEGANERAHGAEETVKRVVAHSEAQVSANKQLQNEVMKLQAENAELRQEIDRLEYELKKASKQVSSQMNFGERMIIDADGEIVGDDTGRVVAKFSHQHEAESFCEAANFHLSAQKGTES